MEISTTLENRLRILEHTVLSLQVRTRLNEAQSVDTLARESYCISIDIFTYMMVFADKGAAKSSHIGSTGASGTRFGDALS